MQKAKIRIFGLAFINYDRWAELYWKKQLEGNLTEKEEKELQNLEKGNLESVKSIYQSLMQDNDVQEWIRKIRSHKWVEVIEGNEKQR